ncbi:MAG: pantetheine-phosphate adenylyltransferase [Pelagibacterales bacterium]|nr:pantetheine-phosphate adenylyltransferase [Pelagibacterales bacterium]OUU61985.1 MAG: pantetheine-phosphate adenylyltransferase [Alphaproteobacteria bacterium TMED62]|tara:strand:+ start:6893 stop:7393 length:501 start_codon:yes stop_codon:yes gene_type:complete
MKEKIGLYPGSFDPITNGHLDIICRASKIVDTLIIGVAINENKKHLFDMNERTKLINEQLLINKSKLSNTKVLTFNELLMSFAEKLKASIIIRGLRAVSDFDYEFQMTGMNARLNSDIETVFLMASEKHQFISSRFVKEICLLKGDVKSFVPPEVHNKLKEKLNKN